jgi:L-ascorbate metabolism protein UlaG (beta-lactamase superfamily)
MNTITAILFISSFCLWTTPRIGAAELKADAESPQEKVVLKWLGVAGWEIDLGKTMILIDPFLTRKEATDREWKTDEDAVSKVIKGADYIFAGHSHHDHIGDIPFIAKRFGSKIIGSRTTTNLALTARVDKSQVITIHGGQKLDFKDFSVQVIESRHGWRGKGRPPRKENQEILRPWQGPIMGRDFVDGGSFLYYFTFGRHRVLHQSTGNVIEEKLKGLRPDVALMNAGHPYDLANVLKTLNPKVIIVHHFDDWGVPFSEGMLEVDKRAQGFRRAIRSVNSQIRVIIPEAFLMTYTLE